MNGWNVKKMHDHCKECSELVKSAMEHAKTTEASHAASAYTDGIGDTATILHQAEVELKPGFVQI